MRRRTGLFLIWLLALAMPVQSTAAAAMMHCATGDAGGTANALEQHAPAVSEINRVHPQQEHEVNALFHSAQSAAGVPHDHCDTAPSSNQTCSACAACCVGAALPGSVAAAPTSAGTTAARLPTLVTQPVLFLTGGLDRPPRRPLA
jgi:hypothetical protein